MLKSGEDMESKFKNKTILITGGTGFVGSHLCKALVSKGANVHIISKSGTRPISVKDDGVYVHKIDIVYKTEVFNLIKSIKPDFVFHLAADINRGREVQIFYTSINTNVIGLLNVLGSLVDLRHNVPVIVAGTAEEYGNNKQPFKEEMREDPVSPYSFSKIASTYLSRAFYKLYSLPIIIIRPTIAYGPGQKSDMFIPSIIHSLSSNERFKMTKGEQTRDFIFIDDLIDAYLKAAFLSDKIAGETINIGYGKPYKIRDVARTISKFMGKQKLVEYGATPYRVGESMNYCVDITKAKRLLGWKPQTDLEEGLKKTIKDIGKYEA